MLLLHGCICLCIIMNIPWCSCLTWYQAFVWLQRSFDSGSVDAGLSYCENTCSLVHFDAPKLYCLFRGSAGNDSSLRFTQDALHLSFRHRQIRSRTQSARAKESQFLPPGSQAMMIRCVCKISSLHWFDVVFVFPLYSARARGSCQVIHELLGKWAPLQTQLKFQNNLEF